MFFSSLDCVNMSGGEIRSQERSIAPILIASYKGVDIVNITSLLILTLINELQIGYVKFLHCKVTLFPSSILYSLEGNLHRAQT